MAAVLLLLVLLAIGLWLRAQVRFMTVMPGRSRARVRRPMTPVEADLVGRLKKHVCFLADEIGARHQDIAGSLEGSIAYIAAVLHDNNYSCVLEQSLLVRGGQVKNLEVEIPGSSLPHEIVVIGAHFDSVLDCPGADDNASGIAALLELARLLHGLKPERTLRFVAFTHEERPNGENGTMGSQFYAGRCRARREKVVAMLSLETMGYYSDEPGSQSYPPPINLLYPGTGNFIGFVGDTTSRDLVHKCLASFRSHTDFPSEGIACWRWVPGVGSSDHEPFWEEGYHALMVTDTAPFRNPHYHTRQDTPDKLDFPGMAVVVAGLARVIEDLVSG